jgi:hypothetical protein
MKPNESWTVLPHGDIEQLATNLFIVEGKVRMPLGETSRHMTIVRLSTGHLVIYSAICLDDARMAQLTALGAPSYLVVPSGIHRLDIKPWRDRFPGMQVIAPHGARERVAEMVEPTLDVDGSVVDLGDPRVSIEAVPGTDGQELTMLVETETGTTLVVNDLIFNLPEMSGVQGFGMKVLGFKPGQAAMPKLVRMRFVKDEKAMRAQLERWAEIPDLERVIVSHGRPILNPRETLHQLAAA